MADIQPIWDTRCVAGCHIESGIAQTNERVSELLRNTLYNSQWLEKPELVEIKATNAAQRRVFDFSMRVTLKRPQAATAATAASMPASAPAAGKPKP